LQSLTVGTLDMHTRVRTLDCTLDLPTRRVKAYKRRWDGLGQSKIATCRKHGYYGRHEHPRRFNNNKQQELE